MHSNLAKHLHTDECRILIEQYENCNKENKYLRLLGFCNDIQNKMTACIQKELKQRRFQGAENKTNRELDYYIKTNPELAAKVKLLEELKAQKAKEEKK